MRYEVEQKFPVTDFSAVEASLRQLGATIEPPVDQSDHYFAHPSRDFAQTDEALRIRRVSSQNYVTYKGPKQDAQTKTRREIELPLPAGDQAAGQFSDLLGALGFATVAVVHKVRRRAVTPWNGQTVEAALDDVEGVGKFVELELNADADGIEDAKSHLQALASHLGLSSSQRRSYLELLLERHAD